MTKTFSEYLNEAMTQSVTDQNWEEFVDDNLYPALQNVLREKVAEFMDTFDVPVKSGMEEGLWLGRYTQGNGTRFTFNEVEISLQLSHSGEWEEPEYED